MFLCYTDPTIFFSLADNKSEKKPSTRMLLAVGNYKDEYKVAVSKKQSLENVVKFL